MNYKFHNKLVLRTPLKAVKSNFEKTELINLFSHLPVKESLFLASPDLLSKFESWKNGRVLDKKEEKKLINSLLKYALRMHSRCTPFGLFAGCSVVAFGEEDSNVNWGTFSISRKTKLDMNVTCTLIQEISKQDIVKKNIKYFPNNSIYKILDKVRYVEYFYRDNKRFHVLNSVDNSAYLEMVLNKAREGASVNELAQLLENKNIDPEPALNFVLELIHSQVIIGDIEPSLTGEELLNRTIDKLDEIIKDTPHPSLGMMISKLNRIKNQLVEIDSQMGCEIKSYENIIEEIKQLNIPYQRNKLFQTDLYFVNNGQEKESNQLNINIQNKLFKAMKVLNKLTAKEPLKDLDEFKKKFYERYENKEVPILEALDVETGVGYAGKSNSMTNATPLVDDLMLRRKKQTPQMEWSATDAFLHQMLLKAHKENQYAVTIEEKDLRNFQENWDDLSDSFSVLFQHVGKKEGADVLYIKDVGGQSATCLLGRFADAHDEIMQVVNEVVKAEEALYPEKLLAEIVHLPESRIGNVLRRPAFRKYEIPYLCKSTLKEESIIALDDLTVSVIGGQLVLRSKRLNKQVLPCLGNAHRYSANTLPVYHFLCELQLQNIRRNIRFNWGSAKNIFTFLPRAETSGVIIFPATWQFELSQYELLLKPDIDVVSTVAKWKKKWMLPDLVLYCEADNTLLIDLNNELSINLFISLIKKRSFALIQEFLHDSDSAIVRDANGDSYNNEFIAVLYKEKKEEPDANLNLLYRNGYFSNVNIVRSFSIGSEWLYYKLYCGVKSADKLLIEVIQPFVNKLLEEKLIDKWFFIRYADPDAHLRVRFHIPKEENLGKVIRLFGNQIDFYHKSKVIWKVQADTYQREVERYGANTMELSEDMFYFNSAYIAEILGYLYKNRSGENLRWMLGIVSIDRLLGCFNYSIDKRKKFTETLKENFFNEFGAGRSLKRQLDKKYRIYDTKVNKMLETGETLDPTLKQIILKNVNRISPIVEQIFEIKKRNKLEISTDELLSSYIHMMINRLIGSDQRLHEMVIYDFLWRQYRSKIARRSKNMETANI